MTSSSIQIQARASLDSTHEDLRPMSRKEFLAVLQMVAVALVSYVIIMKLFVSP